MAQSPQRYKDKVTIVTGGGKGIGAGVVSTFANAGSFVVFADIDVESGKKLEHQLNECNPGRCFFIKCDVTKSEDLKHLVQFTVDKFNGIDCLINNAGTHPDHRPIDGFSVAEFKKLLDMNLVSCYELSQLTLPHLRKRAGNIINMASLVGTMGQVGATTYVTTKAALIGLTKALAIDEAAHGVRVNSISPGNVWTSLWENSVANLPNKEEIIQTGREAQLLGRMGTTDEVGRLCLFLAAEATFTTGVDHVISGGAELAYGKKSQLKH